MYIILKIIDKEATEKIIQKEIKQKTQGAKNDFDKKDHGLKNDGLSGLAKFK